MAISSSALIRDANSERETLPIIAAAKRAGVSRRTIYNWIASGKVEWLRTASGRIRVFTDTLWREPGTAPKGQLVGSKVQTA